MSAFSDPLLDPGFHFFRYPRYSAGAKLNPLGELAGAFQSRDVREAVGDAVGRLEFLLRYELPVHRKSLCERGIAMPG